MVAIWAPAISVEVACQDTIDVIKSSTTDRTLKGAVPIAKKDVQREIADDHQVGYTVAVEIRYCQSAARVAAHDGMSLESPISIAQKHGYVRSRDAQIGFTVAIEVCHNYIEVP